MEKLRERLKFFMAKYGLSIEDVAKKIGKDPKTIWHFLHDKGKPQIQTEYRIRALVEESERINER